MPEVRGMTEDILCLCQSLRPIDGHTQITIQTTNGKCCPEFNSRGVLFISATDSSDSVAILSDEKDLRMQTLCLGPGWVINISKTEEKNPKGITIPNGTLGIARISSSTDSMCASADANDDTQVGCDHDRTDRHNIYASRIDLWGQKQHSFASKFAADCSLAVAMDPGSPARLALALAQGPKTEAAAHRIQHPHGNADEPVEDAWVAARTQQDLQETIMVKLVNMVTCSDYDASCPVLTGMKVTFDIQEMETSKAMSSEVLAYQAGLKTSAIPQDPIDRGLWGRAGGTRR